MTREQAIEVLKNRYYSGVTRSRTDDEWRMATDTAIAALRGPVPDSDTGLLPCGCGGKAQMGKLLYTGNDPDLMPDLMTEYYAYCQDCGITTDNSTDMERVENEWNRAMGWRASE